MRFEIVGVAVWVIVGCGGGAAEGGGGMTSTGSTTSPSTATSTSTHVGIVDRASIEADLPAWREAREGATIDVTAAQALAGVPAGAEVDVVLGVWCGDSRREVSRLWKALDAAGTQLPFAVRFIGVDRAKEAPDGLIDGMEIRYVPTIIVRRDGREVGRIIESAPNGIERELLALLRGERQGVITGRTDL